MNQISIGERWVYAIGDNPPGIEVTVLQKTSGQGGRVFVHFVGDAERADGWVHPTQLKALWDEREVYFVTAAKWRELVSEPDRIEGGAVDAIFREFLAPAATINHGNRVGTVTIFDDDLVDVFMGGGLDRILQGAMEIRDGEVSHYGWSIAVSIARALARAKPHRVMAYVHQEETRGRELASGLHRSRSTQQPRDTSGAHAAFYEEYMRPMCDLLRSWCGKNAADVSDELLSLRADVARLTTVSVQAARALAATGDLEGSRGIYLAARPGENEAEWKKAIEN